MILCQFQVYSKVNQPYIHMFLFPFRFFSGIGYHRTWSRFSCQLFIPHIVMCVSQSQTPYSSPPEKKYYGLIFSKSVSNTKKNDTHLSEYNSQKCSRQKLRQFLCKFGLIYINIWIKNKFREFFCAAACHGHSNRNINK